MKCDEIQQRLDDYLDGDLDTILVSMLEQHITSCEKCHTKVTKAKLLQSELKRALNKQYNGENTLTDEFISSAFEKVREQYPERLNSERQNRFASIGVKTGFVTALAAGFSMWAILVTFILPGMDSSNLANNTQVTESASKLATLNLNIDETRIVRIAIETKDEFDKVTFSVILPKHIELKGHKNKREISWDTKLAKGNNILRIPLKAIKYGQGEFIAKMTHNGKVKTFKLFLKSDKPDLSHIHSFELQV